MACVGSLKNNGPALEAAPVRVVNAAAFKGAVCENAVSRSSYNVQSISLTVTEDERAGGRA